MHHQREGIKIGSSAIAHGLSLAHGCRGVHSRSDDIAIVEALCLPGATRALVKLDGALRFDWGNSQQLGGTICCHAQQECPPRQINNIDNKVIESKEQHQSAGDWSGSSNSKRELGGMHARSTRNKTYWMSSSVSWSHTTNRLERIGGLTIRGLKVPTDLNFVFMCQKNNPMLTFGACT